ncbi:MAG: zinc-ribbon domain-containing protein [Oscillospiraceae bacterium]
MAFCTSCGSKIDDDSTFCEHCGAKQDLPLELYSASIEPSQLYDSKPVTAKENTSNSDDYNEIEYDITNSANTVSTQKKPYPPLSQEVKLAILVSACVFLLFGGFFFITKQIFTPEKTISKFLESIRDKDYAKFSSVTVPVKKELVINKETIAPFFEICDNHSELLTQFKNTLKSDINELRSDVPADGDGFLRLIKNEHIFFTTYKVEMSGVGVAFTSAIPDATVTLGEKSASIPDADTDVIMKNIIPGVYDFKATAKNDFNSDDFTYKVDKMGIFPYGNGKIDLKFDYATLTIQRPENTISSLTINDKTYKGDILFLNNKDLKIFPLNIGDDIKVSFDIDKIKMSDSYKIKENENTFTPQLKLPQSCRIEAMELAGNFIKSYYAAINAKDIEKLKTLGDSKNNFINGNIKQFEKDLEYPESRIDYKFTITNIQGDLDLHITRSNKYNLYFSGKVFVTYDYHFDKYKSGSTAPSETKMIRVLNVLTFILVAKKMENGCWTLLNPHTTVPMKKSVSQYP